MPDRTDCGAGLPSCGESERMNECSFTTCLGRIGNRSRRPRRERQPGSQRPTRARSEVAGRTGRREDDRCAERFAGSRCSGPASWAPASPRTSPTPASPCCSSTSCRRSSAMRTTPSGLTSEDPRFRNKLALAGLEGIKKSKPALLYSQQVPPADRGRQLRGRLAPARRVRLDRRGRRRAPRHQAEGLRRASRRSGKPGTIVSSNTSGLSINEMTEGRSEDFRQHFLVTHFFNPVRYMRLLELVARRGHLARGDGLHGRLRPLPPRQGHRLRQGHAELRRQPDRRLRHRRPPFTP